MRIGIAGCGGIGSNIAYHLVRSGVKNLKFGDFDKIEETNLNRQFYFKNQIGEYKAQSLEKNLKLINPNLNIEASIIKFERDNIRDFFKDVDIIIEGFDKKEYKKILIEELLSLGKPIISASGIGDSDTTKVKIKNIAKNLIIIGDFEKDIRDYRTYSHKVGLISCLMAEKVLELGGYFENKD